MADYNELVEAGKRLAAREKAQRAERADVIKGLIGELSSEPEQAAETMVELFECTVFSAEESTLGEDEDEQAEAMAKFWKRCEELAGMILHRRPEAD